MRNRASGCLFLGFMWLALASGLYAQEREVIEVNGQELAVYKAGWDNLEAGSPVVVFEGGATTPIETWRAVMSRVAEHSPVVAYDPPGVGSSPWSEHLPTLEVLNTRLHSILGIIDASGPYVLVAHSWASWVVRGYSGRYPDEVAGLVLLDPTPPQSEFAAAFEALGIGATGPGAFRRLMEQVMADAPVAVRAQQTVINQYAEAGIDPDVPEYANVPVVVLVAGRYSDPGVPNDPGDPFDMDAFLVELRSRQIVSPMEWVRQSPNGTLLLANEASHCIQCDEPELVAWAIERVLAATHRR